MVVMVSTVVIPGVGTAFSYNDLLCSVTEIFQQISGKMSSSIKTNQAGLKFLLHFAACACGESPD